MMLEAETLGAWLRLYLEVNGLLGLGWGVLYLLRRLEGRRQRRATARGWLRLGQWVWGLCLVLPWCMASLPGDALLQPAAQVWGGQGSGSGGGLSEAKLVLSTVQPGAAGQRLEVQLSAPWLMTGLGLLLGGGLLALSRYLGQVQRLGRTLGGLPVIRRVGRVLIMASPDDVTPFSAWLPRQACVVVPERLLMHADDFRLAVAHELQHHRQRDTLWVHGMALVQALCFWNPALRGWSRLMSELQEFACDEALVGRQWIMPQAYGRCLLRTAQAALIAQAAPAGTTGMAAGFQGTLLRRRVEMVIKRPERARGSWLVLMGCTALLLMSVSAYASRSAVQDQTVSLEQAQSLARSASSGAFPVVANPQVLEKLNRFVGTPKGRTFIQEALKRLPALRGPLEAQLTQARLPLELLAIPLIESGFLNQDSRFPEPSAAPPGPRGSGLWMFIPETARQYGLVVDPAKGIDERLDVGKETGAAVALLGELYRQYGDWGLALAAYNQGQKQVNLALSEGGTRDVWQLMKDGRLNDYVAIVMAGAIILRHPELVE